MNEEAIRLCCTAGLLLNCEINPYSKFDRKNYFYPDMPKNYQISQYDKPLCLGGYVMADVGGVQKKFELTRIHQEEDVAKNTHMSGASLIDFNRAGVPLMEIVTEPCMHTPDDALALLQALKQILQYGNIGDCNLERGNMRCDVNCSVRPVGRERFGTKTEIKNMNTFKGVYAALTYEIKRQVDVLKGGGAMVQETRRWNPDTETTTSMRTKEDAHDYRYFPEPDLMPIVLDKKVIEEWRSHLPELPAARRARFIETFGLPEYDAEVLVADKDIADFFDETVKSTANCKAASNWIMTELMREMSEGGIEANELNVTPSGLAALIDQVDKKVINSSAAKKVFHEMFVKGGEPEAIIEQLGLVQVSDTGALEDFADQAIAENPKSVEDYKAGKKAALQYLMGQVMRMSKGKANPQMVLEMLKSKLH